jgi:hypothetical protein
LRNPFSIVLLNIPIRSLSVLAETPTNSQLLNENPHEHQDQRLKFMEAMEEEDEFFGLGNEVCGDDTVWSALEEYAKKNAAAFPVAVN